jgi:acylphosphatase
MNRCRRYVISGTVQGVFYRASAQTVARRLGLTGWVRNLADGRVEAIACGPQAKLAAFTRWLWQGPPEAIVSSIEEIDVAEESFTSFEVRGSGY